MILLLLWRKNKTFNKVRPYLLNVNFKVFQVFTFSHASEKIWNHRNSDVASRWVTGRQERGRFSSLCFGSRCGLTCCSGLDGGTLQTYSAERNAQNPIWQITGHVQQVNKPLYLLWAAECGLCCRLQLRPTQTCTLRRGDGDQTEDMCTALSPCKTRGQL